MRLLAMLSVLIVCLSSCLLVEDFGAMWDRAEVDSDFPGQWYKEPVRKEQFLIVRDDDKLIQIDPVKGDRVSQTDMKTLTWDGYKFLLLKGPDAQAMFYYTLEDDNLTLYAPIIKKRPAIINHSVSTDNMIDEREGIRVLKLDEDVMHNLVGSIKDKMWQPAIKFVRNIKETIPESMPVINNEAVVEEENKVEKQPIIGAADKPAEK